MVYCPYCKKTHEATHMCREMEAFVRVGQPVMPLGPILPPLTAAVPLAPLAFQESGTATVGPFGSVAHPKNRQQAEMMVSIALDWLTKNSRDYKHRNGGTYLKLATATVQVQSSLTDMDKVVVYIGEDGEWWVRHPEEFEERFTKL